MRNIVFIVVDTLRADHLGCYGYERDTSPCLDSLAARGVTLDSLWSASNFTAPAFSTIFTGLPPNVHGVFDFGAQLGNSSIGAAFEKAGMRTGGIVTFRFFRRLLGSIWGDIEAITDTRSFNYDKNSPRAVAESAEEWLEAYGKDGPFCLFLHWDGPHMPYRLPSHYESRFDTVDPSAVDPDALRMLFPQDQERIHGQAGGHVLQMFDWIESVSRGRRELSPETIQWMKDKYDASIRYNDDQIERVLDKLRQLNLDENTVVGVISDHGEEFLDHGFLAHGGIHLYEELIRTAGIVVDPQDGGGASALGAPGSRLATPRGHIGVLPTLMARAGLELPPDLAGSTGRWLRRTSRCSASASSRSRCGAARRSGSRRCRRRTCPRRSGCATGRRCSCSASSRTSTTTSPRIPASGPTSRPPRRSARSARSGRRTWRARERCRRSSRERRTTWTTPNAKISRSS